MTVDKVLCVCVWGGGGGFMGTMSDEGMIKYDNDNKAKLCRERKKTRGKG